MAWIQHKEWSALTSALEILIFKLEIASPLPVFCMGFLVNPMVAPVPIVWPTGVHSHRFQVLQYGGIYQQAYYYELLGNLETKQRERRGKTYLISYKLNEYGTSECHRPLSQFGPNHALEHKWQQQEITPCYDEDPVLIFKVELHPTKSISAHLWGVKKHNCMCTSACTYV